MVLVLVETALCRDPRPRTLQASKPLSRVTLKHPGVQICSVLVYKFLGDHHKEMRPIQLAANEARALSAPQTLQERAPSYSCLKSRNLTGLHLLALSPKSLILSLMGGGKRGGGGGGPHTNKSAPREPGTSLG